MDYGNRLLVLNPHLVTCSSSVTKNETDAAVLLVALRLCSGCSGACRRTQALLVGIGRLGDTGCPLPLSHVRIDLLRFVPSGLHGSYPRLHGSVSWPRSEHLEAQRHLFADAECELEREHADAD
jgi:hypothetical protein